MVTVTCATVAVVAVALLLHPTRPVSLMSVAEACADLRHIRDGRRVVVPGIVLLRQKPGSVKGVVFITLRTKQVWRT